MNRWNQLTAHLWTNVPINTLHPSSRRDVANLPELKVQKYSSRTYRLNSGCSFKHCLGAKLALTSLSQMHKLSYREAKRLTSRFFISFLTDCTICLMNRNNCRQSYLDCSLVPRPSTHTFRRRKPGILSHVSDVGVDARVDTT